MSPKEAKELLSSMFSEDGGQINGVKICVESPTSFVISENEDNSIFIDFPNQKIHIKREDYEVKHKTTI